MAAIELLPARITGVGALGFAVEGICTCAKFRPGCSKLYKTSQLALTETQSRQTEPKAASPAGSMKDGRREECAATQTQSSQAGHNYGFTAQADGWMSGSTVRLRRCLSSGPVGTPAPQAGATLDGTGFACEPPQGRRSRQAGGTQASSAGRSQEGVLRAFVRMDEGWWRRLVFRHWSGLALRHSGTKCGERFGGTGACRLRGVSRTKDRSLGGWRNVDKSDRINALWRSDVTRCGAFRCDAACVSRQWHGRGRIDALSSGWNEAMTSDRRWLPDGGGCRTAGTGRVVLLERRMSGSCLAVLVRWRSIRTRGVARWVERFD